MVQEKKDNIVWSAAIVLVAWGIIGIGLSIGEMLSVDLFYWTQGRDIGQLYIDGAVGEFALKSLDALLVGILTIGLCLFELIASPRAFKLSVGKRKPKIGMIQGMVMCACSVAILVWQIFALIRKNTPGFYQVVMLFACIAALLVSAYYLFAVLRYKKNME